MPAASNGTSQPTAEEEQQNWSQRSLINGSKDVNALAAEPFGEPFHFIQAADSQFGLIDRYLKHLDEPGWREETELSEALVSAVNQMQPRPKFLVVCGDLVDAGPGSGETRGQQVAEFKRIFSKLSTDIPLVCVCGNHDVGDEPTMDAIQEYKQTFTDDYFYFALNGVLFIVINSQFYQHRVFVEDYARQHDEWLDSVLAKCKLFKHSIVFQHIPWFLENPDEDDQYFNVRREIRLNWLRKFKDAGVSKIMCGHYHRNAGGWYGDDLELVVTSAIGAQLGEDKSGCRVVKVGAQSIEHQYYAIADIPQKVDI